MNRSDYLNAAFLGAWIALLTMGAIGVVRVTWQDKVEGFAYLFVSRVAFFGLDWVLAKCRRSTWREE